MGMFGFKCNCVWILLCFTVRASSREIIFTNSSTTIYSSTLFDNYTSTTEESTQYTTSSINLKNTIIIELDNSGAAFLESSNVTTPESNTTTVTTDDVGTILFNTSTIIPVTPIPSAINITGLNVCNITSDSVYLYWTVTEGPRDNFTVTIERIQTGHDNHYWRNSCDSGISEANFSRTTNKTTLFVNEFLLPDFFYIVRVTLKNSTSEEYELDSNATLNFTTLPAASDKPENLTYEIIDTNYTKNIYREIILSWEMPCNTNGPVDLFFIDVFSSYHYGDEYSNVTYIEYYYNNGSDSFNFTVKDVPAASNYSITVYASGEVNSTGLNGTTDVITFITGDNYPSQPKAIKNEISPNNVTLFWEEPNNNPGNIISYKVQFNFLELNWDNTSECFLNSFYFDFGEEVRETTFSTDKLISGATYDFKIIAQTSIGWGNFTKKQLTSSMSEPEAVNITVTSVNESTILDFTPGCFFGEFGSYYIEYKESRNETTNVYIPVNITDYTMTSLNLTNTLPEMRYEVKVTVSNLEFNRTSTATFKTPSIIPSFNMEKITESASPTNISTDQVILTLNKQVFTNDHNPLLYMAIIISNKNQTGGDIQQWDTNTWPSVSPENNEDIYYQATEKFYNPFADEDTVYFVLGTNGSCQSNQDNCNAPLQPGTTYYVFFRLFNAKYYKNTMPLSFVTEKINRIGLILGIIFGILIFAVLAVGFVMWRKGIINKLFNKVRPSLPISKTDIPQAEFINYCRYLEEHPDDLEKQWQELQEKSVEIYSAHESAFAVLPENRRKNRYTDILPFDQTRVKLNIDEDDEMCSDYINASYIKGFSTDEYIATQGPLPHTVREFWKMVIQENVSIIVMVARFYENKMEKCFRYFPNNHEMILFGDDIEVHCATELNLNTYCVRTLEVRKGLKQQTVIHMQFLEWPDFGVPKGTDDLIYFCNQFRERWEAEGGRAVVHCSAGVGRTGTIIATDILIKTIKAGRKIDVFNTVLELRKQRKSMVQRQTQYLYIFQMIRCFLEEGGCSEPSDSLEHIYENIQLAKNFRKPEENSL